MSPLAPRESPRGNVPTITQVTGALPPLDCKTALYGTRTEPAGSAVVVIARGSIALPPVAGGGVLGLPGADAGSPVAADSRGPAAPPHPGSQNATRTANSITTIDTTFVGMTIFPSDKHEASCVSPTSTTVRGVMGLENGRLFRNNEDGN